MSRQDEFKTQNPNPSTKFLEWKSDDKNFSFWDKVKKAETPVPIPLVFLVLKDLSTVGGWHDASESGIYGNEIKDLSEETIKVNAYKSNGPIAEGLYKEIKQTVSDAGGYYVKSLYVMLKDGTIVNIKLKGSAVKAWSDFTAKNRQRLSDEWVSVYDAEELKKGKIKYSVPMFKFDKSLSKPEGQKADLAYDIVDGYFNAKTSGDDVNSIETEHEEVIPSDLELDPDIDF